MSATRKPRAQRGLDFYETPAWCVRALIPHLPAAAWVLDPCAGRGAILHELIPFTVRGFEIDAELARTTDLPLVVRDALSPEPWNGYARVPLVVMNPPFTHAEAFVRRALDELAPGGTVAALLRLGFLEGQARAPLHREHPADVLVLPRRPSFTGKGTDASAYAWFVWGPGRGGRWQILDTEATS